VFWEGTFAAKPDVVASIKRVMGRTPPLAIAGTLLALAARTDTTPSLGSISVPTLILVGEHDAVTPPAASRAMHERIPGSHMHVIPAAGHMSNIENPEVFNEQLLAFLKRF
jgi:3-oxoadipate enol-lactonase